MTRWQLLPQPFLSLWLLHPAGPTPLLQCGAAARDKRFFDPYAVGPRYRLIKCCVAAKIPLY